ncbi:MAG: hypothetical protein IJM57_06745 [Lachnospiraceae bacterium]|nr:hypothetical protein [Lachnospiraceae bacterium]
MVRKLERRFGKYAIRGLMKYVILLYALGFVLAIASPNFYRVWLTFDVEKIFLHGQVWRFVTFLIQPVEGENIFFILITMYLYYFIGNMLEMRWGSFRFNLFYFAGMLFNIVMAILAYGVFRIALGVSVTVPISIAYINLAMFFAFAVEFGEVQLLLFFIIPVKVKYLGLFYAGMYAWEFVSVFIKDGAMAFLILFLPFVFGILNFIVYWIASRKTRAKRRATISDLRRKMAYMQGVNAGVREGSVVNTVGNKKVITKHRCAVCGRTELDDDMLEFRFCSKCEGDYEYCMDHLYTHTHVKREPAGSFNSQITQDLANEDANNSNDSGDTKES